MTRRAPTARRSAAPAVWLACALAATVLTLSVNGTLSSWTSAIITNDTNTVATAGAVILKEANAAGTTTCYSSANADNIATCSTLNKYGGTASPLIPGGNQVTTVTFTDAGARNGTSFSLAPGACQQTPTAGSGTPATANVCTNGDLTVDLRCSPGTTYSSGSAWSDLSYAAAAPPTATKTHTAASGDLNAGASWTCQITVALSATASVLDQAVTVSQPLVWTLNG